MKADPREGNSFYYDLDATPLNDLPFYRRFVTKRTSVLELGCGTGRVLVPLALDCQSIVGIDSSQDMVDRCQSKLKENGIPETQAMARVGDITALDLGRTFDLVTAPYRVLQALETSKEVEGLFGVIRRHLAPGGACILNVFRPSRERAVLADGWCRPEFECWQRMLPDGSRVVHSEVYDRIDKDKMVLFPKLIYRKYRGDALLEEFVQPIKMKCYWPEEFRSLIESAGFRILDAWGGYEGEAYGVGKELVVRFGV